MGSRFLLALGATGVSLSSAIRFEDDLAVVVEEASRKSGLNDVDTVDFAFMTNNFQRPPVTTNLWTWLQKIFLRRRTKRGDIREELIDDHTCARKDLDLSDAMTYYASSHCYWLPEYRKEAEDEKGPGLFWSGGRDTFRKDFCGGLTGEGMCVKCFACHDDAMNSKGVVKFKSWTQEIPLLDSTCLKEKAIEEECMDEFQAEFANLTSEWTRCGGLKREFEESTIAYDTAINDIDALERIIKDLPVQINATQEDIVNQSRLFNDSQELAESERDLAYDDCEQLMASDYGFMAWWFDMNKPERTIETILHDMMTLSCSQGTNYFAACRLCVQARDRISAAVTGKSDAQAAKQQAEGKLADLQDQLETAGNDLDDLQTALPDLETAKNASSDAWLPEQTLCLSKLDEYETTKLEEMRTCTPTKYDKSCEKACIEVMQSFAGCGVVEGSGPEDGTGRGGMQLTCQPPQPSWVMAPWTYGASEQAGRQCHRLASAQPSQRSQQILKSGWMHKKGRFFGWNVRYFFLQSGDQVRSAILYHYDSDPAQTAGEIPAFRKQILVWDAKSAHSVGGWTYGKAGYDCLMLVHYYRNFNFCLRETTERDEWLALLLPEILPVDSQ